MMITMEQTSLSVMIDDIIQANIVWLSPQQLKDVQLDPVSFRKQEWSANNLFTETYDFHQYAQTIDENRSPS